MPPVWDRVREQRPGIFARTREWWEFRVVADPEARRGGGGPKRFVVAERDGVPEGYAIYRHHTKFEEGVSRAKLERDRGVRGDARRRRRSIWRFLRDVDWMETIAASLIPIDHPLVLMLATPRRMRFRVGDGLWVRLVDVGAALSARSYRGDGAVVFEVRDAFCPWNEGRWRLEAAAPSGPTTPRTSRSTSGSSAASTSAASRSRSSRARAVSRSCATERSPRADDAVPHGRRIPGARRSSESRT